MDAGGKGVLSQEDVQTYLNQQGYGQDEMDRFFRRCDVNEDGHLSFDEFKRAWHFLGKLTISGVAEPGASVLRKPGAIKGRDVVIEDCKESTVTICDHTAQVQVDSCESCKILIGPCADSVFLRGCRDCNFSVAARQLRTRDCERCTIYLYCQTEPIIETS